MTQEVTDLRQIRIDKLNELMAAGKNPYVIDKYPRDSFAKDILENFEEYEGKQVAIAGRLMLKRNMGKTSFINVMDSTGDIQVYVRQDQVGEEPFADFLTFDRGDIIGVTGDVFRTKKGERSIKAHEVVLLAKCLQTLPEKYHGLKDTDLRYRQRYVDLIINSEIKEVFFKRNVILRGIRRFMDDLGYLEVETPILQTVAGGAAARPFLTYHNALNLDMQLRIANELFLKRLIVGGFDKVYEMGKMFRNEGISIRHNPEYTMIELYAAHHNYEDMMELLETLVETLALELYGTTVVTYQDREIDVKVPWKRISMNDLVIEKTGVDFFSYDSLEEAKKVAKSLELDVEDFMTEGHLVNLAFEEFCEEDLIQPTFVLHHPVEISPLAKRNPVDERITNRFEAFINGWEIANAFSELNDPIDQRERFIAQVEMKEMGDSETHPMDEDFLTAIEVGMPPTGGMGIGVDRLVMLLTNMPSIRDVIFFPTMKPIDK
ncbi:MAG: lysine--tRNA ligase [Bacillota bacterium]|nr:lysine--tRNA ligase [Bacillota bacterium]